MKAYLSSGSQQTASTEPPADSVIRTWHEDNSTGLDSPDGESILEACEFADATSETTIMKSSEEELTASSRRILLRDQEVTMVEKKKVPTK